jgi:hypothetical protein
MPSASKGNGLFLLWRISGSAAERWLTDVRSRAREAGMETNNDPGFVVLTREHFDWILEMAAVGVHEWKLDRKMLDVLHQVNQTNPHLPNMEGWEC